MGPLSSTLQNLRRSSLAALRPISRVPGESPLSIDLLDRDEHRRLDQACPMTRQFGYAALIYDVRMDTDGIRKLVPDLLEKRHPGRSREVIDGAGQDLGWVLDFDSGIALVRAAEASHPFIWIRAGLAHAVPKTDALAWRIAAGNKDLMVGRFYVAYGDDLAMVVFDEAISAANLSFDYPPSIEDLVDRFEMSLQYATEWSQTIRQEFGGRPFSSQDWGLMSF